MSSEKKTGKKKSIFRRLWFWGLIFLLILILTPLGVLGYFFKDALRHRYVDFPKTQAAWEAIRADRHETPARTRWKEYRGVCHSHSYLSHDSEMPFEDILQVLKDTDRQFICMSDHCAEGRADYSLQWSGVYNNVLFIPGYEMYDGFMPWGLPRDTVLECGADQDLLAKEIGEKDGFLFFAHPENPRRWDLPDLVGTEIYNIHTDLLDEELAPLIPDILLNMWDYPMHTFRLIFDRPTQLLEQWDRMSKQRRFPGIAANDCHQNQGVYGVFTAAETLLVRQSDDHTIGEYPLNRLERLLLRSFFGPLEPNRELFRYQLDPYSLLVQYVATHVLAAELTQEAVLGAMSSGRIFVGFDAIADSTGFVWEAENASGQAVMGEDLPFSEDTELRAYSPHVVRFTIMRDGEVAYQTEGTSLKWRADLPGNYRVEAELNILDEWTPWVYTNPINLTAQSF